MSQSSRVSEIVRLLEEASDAYYNSDSSTMSDVEYDQLRDELERLDPKNVFLAQVGALVKTSGQKIKLTIPMGSLDKIYTTAEFETWLKSTVSSVCGKNPSFAVQPKLDGSSIEIMYRNGKFHRASTRGDGIEGEDVSVAIRKARGVPQTISVSGDVFVRGESIISIEDWEKHFKPEGHKNPRNSSNGTTGRDDGDGAEHLNFIAFNIISQGFQHTTFYDKMNWLSSLKFKVAETYVVNAEDLPDYIDGWKNKRAKYPFVIDGLVVKVNSENDQEKLGENNNRPYWARAWKFEAEGGESVIEDVTWDVGTRGTITPVAVIKPLDVAGVTISNITLHNMSEIERKDIQIGDEVRVVRAGDVIPYIEKVVRRGSHRTRISIQSCPGCGGSVVRDGPFLRCSNPTRCSGTQSKRIKGWIAKRDIKYLGDSNFALLITNGVVKSVADLYFLTKDKMVAAGLGERMSEKILEEIKKSMDVEFSNLVGSLSIDLLGRRQAKKIVEAGFVSLDQWRNLTPEQLMKHEGFQDTKANRIIESLRSNWPIVEGLAGMLNVQYDLKKPTIRPTGKLGAKSFCFTGAMSKPRKELQFLVEAQGGVNRDDVSGDLDFLVIEDVNSQSSKAKKARKLGTKLLSENEFLSMVGI